MRKYWGIYLFVIVLIVLVLAAGFFVWSGGWSLISLYREYLSKDLPDKKYSYLDFTDRGPRTMLSGYYSGRLGDSVYIWTLSGLKRFSHRPGTSVYYLMNICGVVRTLAEKEQSEEGFRMEPWRTFEIDAWAEGVRRGDYVWVVRAGEGAEGGIIDKIWASDNAHYPYRGVILSECQKR